MERGRFAHKIRSMGWGTVSVYSCPRGRDITSSITLLRARGLLDGRGRLLVLTERGREELARPVER